MLLFGERPPTMDGNTLHRQHPRPHSLAASWKSSDIELEYIVPPCTETASTRGLLVAPDSASAKTDVETGQPPPKSASGRTTISIHDTNRRSHRHRTSCSTGTPPRHRLAGRLSLTGPHPTGPPRA